MKKKNPSKPNATAPAKNKGGRPRKHPPKDPDAPKRKPGRPKKTINVTTRLPQVSGGQLTDDQLYDSALLSRNRQRERVEALANSLYDAIDKKVARGITPNKEDYELFEKYELRLRLIDNDLIDLRKTRLEERKLEQALRLANESKVTTINISIVPPPPPVKCPYDAADYKKDEEQVAEETAVEQ